jgi:hypothetical protein
MELGEEIDGLSCYNMRRVIAQLQELKDLITNENDREKDASERQRDILAFLAASTRVLIEGRDDGFINNVRGLQHMGFLSQEEAELALRIGSKPDPVNDFEGLIGLAKIFAKKLPLYKENLTC